MNDENNNNDFLSEVNKTESFQEEKFEKQKIDYVKWSIIIIILIGIVIAAYFVLNQKVEVIDFTDMTQDSIDTWAESNGIQVAYTTEYSEFDEDTAISQNVEAESKVSKNTTIKVTLSEGSDPYEKINLPDFDSSWSRASIVNWINEYEIENSSIVQVESSDIDEGYLISYNLFGANEEDFNRSSEIEFVVSQITEITTVEMQDFINQTLTSVDAWAKTNNVSYSYTYEYSDIYEKDRLISQSIDSGDNFSVETKVEFVVSKGSNTVTMESFVNKNVLELDAFSKENGISYTISYEYSDTYDENRIIEQNILPNTDISTEDEIEVIVSLGAESSTIEMPSFISSDMSSIDSWAKETGISYNIKYEYSDLYDYGKVISQNIVPNEEILTSTNLTFTISKGLQITVPDFSKMTETQIDQFAKDNNVVITIKEKYNSNTSEGDFLSQSIAPNERVDEETEITIYYSLGYLIKLPDYRNKLKTEFIDFINTANKNGASIIYSTKVDDNSDIDAGYIVTQSIYNEYINLNEKIEISVSNGITVPDFSKYSIDEANSYKGPFTLNIIEEYNNDVEKGSLILQSLKAFSKEKSDTEITLIYSLGNEISIGDYRNKKLVEIQNFVDEANSNNANITLSIYYEYNDIYVNNYEYGIIISQSSFSEKITINDEVIVRVSLGDPFVVPDFSYHTEESLKNYALVYDVNIVCKRVDSKEFKTGEVVSQSIPVGTTISKKDFIIIEIAK